MIPAGLDQLVAEHGEPVNSLTVLSATLPDVEVPADVAAKYKIEVLGPLPDPKTAGVPPAHGARLIPVEQHTFRMQGGAINGELIRFEVDEAGKVTQLRGGQYTLWRTT